MAQFHKVARVAEIPPGTGRSVDADGEKAALFNLGGEFYAIDNTCPHQGGPLGEGIITDCVVTCPYHFWQFDIKTGKSPEFPEACVDRYAVKVEGDEISVCFEPLKD